MTHHLRITILIGVLGLAAMIWAQDRITEEDVVSVLDGKPRTAAPGHPLGVALHVTFSPQTAAGAKGKRPLSGGNPQVNESLYKTLIPLAWVLEAEMVRGSRFVVRVGPTFPLPVEDANVLGWHLANTVEHFLTTYFAIPRERLSLQVAPIHSRAEEPSASPQRPQRWRLEVFRQE
jgi:hypothetical protein